MTQAEIASKDQIKSSRGTGRAIEAFVGGAAVAVLGLSLNLATGTLSVTPLGPEVFAYGVVAAFVASTIGAIVASLASRERGAVSGARTSIAVTYAALCADLVARSSGDVQVGQIFAALAIAVILMGMLQIAAGWLHLADALKYLPSPVTAGFVSGIGLLIVWSQVGPLLGLEGRLSKYHLEDLWAAYKPAALAIGIFTAAIVWLTPRITKKVQPLLVALVIGTLTHHVVAHFIGSAAAGPVLGPIDLIAAAYSNVVTVWSATSTSWLVTTVIHVLPFSVFLAIQGALNAGLVSVALADIKGERCDLNRVMIGQGVANIVCGALAALPIGTSPIQSSAAAKMSRVRNVVPIASALILLVGVALFGPLLAYIPMAVLAGILITSGIGLIDRWARGLIVRALKGDLRREILGNIAIVIAVTSAFFFGSVPLALFVGAVLAMLLLTMNLASATTFEARNAVDLASTRVWPPQEAEWLARQRAAVYVVRPRGSLFFGTADQLADTLAQLPSSARYCVVDLSLLTTIDATGCQVLNANTRTLAKRNIVSVFAGIDPNGSQGRAMKDLGLMIPDGQVWHSDLDHALEWIEAKLVRERWPELDERSAVSPVNTLLAKDLQAGELQLLRERMRTIEVATGAVLFKVGDPGSCIYIVARGEVEIHSGEGAGSKGRRLAAFGPGAMFGEIAVLAEGVRTADAVCTQDATLYELPRDAFLSLQHEAPQTYAKIMRNLNLNLAARLVVATEIVRGRR
jgi:sulfate permease, SulP family